MMINPFSIFSPFKLYAALGMIIALSVVVGVHLYNDRGVRIERDTAVADLASYKTKIEVATALQVAENTKNEAAGKLKIQLAIKVSNDLLAKLNLTNIDRNQLQQKVSVLNAKLNSNKIISDRTRSNLNSILRTPTTGDSTASSKESKARSGVSTADSDTSTLRQACTITTIDLVKAYAIIEADTAACGREK